METIQATRDIRRKSQQITRCAGSKKEQVKFSSVGDVADGFLRHQFLPLFEQGEELPERTQAEKGFLNSLSILSGLYDFELMDVKNKPYPYNILLMYGHIQKQLKKSEQDIELSILQDDEGIIKLATNHTYNTGTTLYYIPVLPLYRPEY